MAASPDLQTPLHPSSEPEKIPLKTGTQEKNAPSQLLPETPDPSTTHVQHELIIKGFTAISVAGAFVASIQSQVMSTTLSANPETKALRSINAFYLVGVILDIISALLAFLSARWFERLTEQEKDLLETVYAYHNLHPDEKALATSRPMRPWETGDRQWLYYSWLGLSLDIPLILLVLGTTCMMVGICIYAWAQHPTVVASFVTLAIAAPLLFIVGVFSIGRKRDRREKLILRLGELQGDW